MTTHAPRKRAFLYGRLSENRFNKSEAIPVQIADSRELAADLGCDPVPDEDIFVDDSITAADPKVTRHAYERMLRRAREEADAGRPVDFIIGQDQDRLVRQPVENEELIALSFETGTIVRCARGDLGGFNPSSRAMSRIKSVMSIYETDQTKVRTKRRHRDRAERGLMHSGGRRGYGHRRDGTVEPDEAAVIREWIALVLGGATVYELATVARARGLTTTSGNLFTWNAIERVLQQARLAGAREVDGELVATGAFDAIIDEATCRLLPLGDDGAPVAPVEVLRQLRSILRVERTAPRRPWRRHLLSGAVYCGECGTRMSIGHSSLNRQGERIYSYSCPPPSRVNGVTGCGSCNVVEHGLQAEVFERVVADLADDEGALARMLQRERESVAGGTIAEAHAEQARAAKAIETIAAEFDDGRIKQAEYRRRRERQQARLDEAQRTLDSAAHASTLLALVPSAEYALRVWRDPQTTDAWRRSLLDLVIERVRVKRGKRGRYFDASRVEIDWR